MTPLEDRTVPAAIPLTGPNGGEWVKVDTLNIATRTNQTAATGVTSAIALEAGKTYLAVARGTARIATDATGFTDAEFIRYNKATGPQDGSSPGYAPNNHGIRLTGVDGGTTTGNFWGTYQSDHVYTKLVQGQGTTITSYYSDIPGYYGDNSGTLTVDVYEESSSGPDNEGSIMIDLPDGSRAIVGYDLAWGEWDASLPHQSLRLSSFSLNLSGQVFVESSADFNVLPIIQFQSGEFTGIDFSVNTVSPGSPYTSVSVSGMTATLTTATGQFFQVLIAAQPPKLATGKTLSWNDYKVVKKADFGAFTGGDIIRNPSTDVKTSSKPEGMGFVGTATLDAKFSGVFLPGSSYVLAGRQTKALLEHERTHLLIVEYVALKATLNLPESFKGATAKGDTAEDAAENAKADLLKVLGTKLDEAKSVMEAITKLYDTETNHGIDKDAQADWERKYIDKIDAYVKKELKWEK